MDNINNDLLADNDFLNASAVFDYDNKIFTDYFYQYVNDDNRDNLEKLVDFYYVVRDKIHYQIFGVDVSSQGLQASSVINNQKGFCLHKSIVFIAAARMLKFPARLKAVHVRNHLASPDVISLMEGKIFLHWYVEVKINDVWLKVTPVFSKIFCQLYGSTPLEFDGKTDSIYQIYDEDKSSTLFFLDAPVTIEPVTAEELIAKVKASHPNFLNQKNFVHENHCLPRVAVKT